MINSTNEKKTEKKPEDVDIPKRSTIDEVIGKKILTPDELETLKRAQIDRNNEWIEKMSPIVKYKIQEYVRKQRAKKMQRRKFSLACGLMNRVKQESSTSSAARKRNRRVNSATTSKKNVAKEEAEDEEEPKESETKKQESKTVTHRRKSAPVRMDMRDLDDLE